MTFHIKHSGAWKEAEVHIKHSGSWKRAEVFVKQGGVWKQAALTVVHELSPQGASASGGSPDYSIQLQSSVTGGTPSSRTWGILSSTSGFWTISGSGSVVDLNVTGAEPLNEAIVTVYCDAVVGGTTYRAVTTFSYQNTSF